LRETDLWSCCPPMAYGLGAGGRTTPTPPTHKHTNTTNSHLHLPVYLSVKLTFGFGGLASVCLCAEKISAAAAHILHPPPHCAPPVMLTTVTARRLAVSPENAKRFTTPIHASDRRKYQLQRGASSRSFVCDIMVSAAGPHYEIIITQVRRYLWSYFTFLTPSTLSDLPVVVIGFRRVFPSRTRQPPAPLLLRAGTLPVLLQPSGPKYLLHPTPPPDFTRTYSEREIRPGN